MNKIEFLKKFNLTEAQFIGAEKIKGNLNLDNLTSIPEGFNPIVEVSLYLNGLSCIPKFFNPNVGLNLYMNKIKSIDEVFNPIVGCDLHMNNVSFICNSFTPIIGRHLWLKGDCIHELSSDCIGGAIFYRTIPTGTNKNYPTINKIFYEQDRIY